MTVVRLAPLLLGCALLGCGGGARQAAAPVDGTTGRGPAPAAPDEMVATVDGQPILASTVRREIIRRGGDVLGRYEKLEAKEQVVEELVRVKLLAQAARQQGYDRDPEFAASVDQMLADRYWRDQVARQDQAPEVADAEVEAYYREHTGDFAQPERVRGAVLFLGIPADAPAAAKQSLRKRAADLRREAAALPATERTFGALAAAHSDDPATRGRGGDLGFIARDANVYDVERAVLDALFALEHPGDLASPVETARGVYLVKLIERAGGTTVPLATVSQRIRQRLTDERVRTLEAERYAKLRAGAVVQVDRERLRAVGPTDVASTSRPPSFPVEEGTP